MTWVKVNRSIALSSRKSCQISYAVYVILVAAQPRNTWSRCIQDLCCVKLPSFHSYVCMLLYPAQCPVPEAMQSCSGRKLLANILQLLLYYMYILLYMTKYEYLIKYILLQYINIHIINCWMQLCKLSNVINLIKVNFNYW